MELRKNIRYQREHKQEVSLILGIKDLSQLILIAPGDFIFTVTVQTPKRLTKEQRELLVQLAKTMNEQPPVKKRGLFG